MTHQIRESDVVGNYEVLICNQAGVKSLTLLTTIYDSTKIKSVLVVHDIKANYKSNWFYYQNAIDDYNKIKE